MATGGPELCARAGAATARAPRTSATVLTTTDFQRIIFICLHRAARNGKARPRQRVGSARLTVNRLKRSRPTLPNNRGRRAAPSGARPPADTVTVATAHERFPAVPRRLRAILRDGARGRASRDAV